MLFTYHILTHSYPGWTLSEMKDLPVLERTWWLEMALWKQKKLKSG